MPVSPKLCIGAQKSWHFRQKTHRDRPKKRIFRRLSTCKLRATVLVFTVKFHIALMYIFDAFSTQFLTLFHLNFWRFIILRTVLDAFSPDRLFLTLDQMYKIPLRGLERFSPCRSHKIGSVLWGGLLVKKLERLGERMAYLIYIIFQQYLQQCPQQTPFNLRATTYYFSALLEQRFMFSEVGCR